MTFLNLHVKSKNRKSINNFTIFYFKILNLNSIKKIKSKKKKHTILTILKSPHVNKKAQEQFEIIFFSKQLTIFNANLFKSSISYKKIKTNLFPDVKIKVCCKIDKKRENTFIFKLLDFDKCKIPNFVYHACLKLQDKKILTFNNFKEKINMKKQTNQYLKLTSCYGEKFLFS